MSERFSEAEGKFGGKRGLEERLRDEPELRAKFESLLDVVENAAGDIEKAAEAERRVTEELRQMGNEVLHAWARRQADRKAEEVTQQAGAQRKEKNGLLADAVRGDQSSRADFPEGAAGARDAPVLRGGGSRVSRLLGTAGAGDRRFWSGCCGRGYLRN